MVREEYKKEIFFFFFAFLVTTAFLESLLVRVCVCVCVSDPVLLHGKHKLQMDCCSKKY